MENASKALLIAASVLIVILLIAAGVRVFNSTSGTTEQVEGAMQTTEVGMFNNKFLPYIGENKNKSEVMSLLNNILANNSTNNMKIKLGYRLSETKSAESTIAQINKCMELISSYNATKKFSVTVGSPDIYPQMTGSGYNSKGYIAEIYISTN